MKVLCSTQMGSGTILGQTMRVVAIAKALQRRGHQIKFLAGEKLIPVLKDYGFDLIRLPEMPEISIPTNSNKADDPAQFAKFAASVKEIFGTLIKAEQAAVTTEKPDLILCGTMTGALTAHFAGIPCVTSALQPHGRKTFTHFLQRMPYRENSDDQISDMMDLFTPGEVIEGDFRQLINRAMDAVALVLIEGMPEIAGDSDFSMMGEWFGKIKDKIRYTGPLLVQTADELPEALVLKAKYLSDPEKPLVYVTIGGGSSLIGEDFLCLVLDTFRDLTQANGFISTGLAFSAEKLANHQIPANVSIRGFVPGTELIKASDLVIFHGGSSTLMNCIACGRPAVVIPSMGEQEDNGAVLAEHGAGIVLDKNSLTPIILKDAIQRILNKISFREQAWKLKELADQYGGAEKAAEMIEEAMKGRVLTGAGAYSGSR